jgi:hypothetical protein
MRKKEKNKIENMQEDERDKEMKGDTERIKSDGERRK